MLGISQNTIKEKIDQKRFISFQKVIDTGRKNTLRNLLISSLIILIVLLVIPWTQNISGHGKLTALEAEKRPQSIQSIIPGRIEKWYVSEGDYVKAGDTIMRITEIVDDYFDPNLLQNAERVIQNKESSVSGYMEKIAALDRQIDAMNESRKIKMSQQEIKISQSILKLQSDSVESNAARANLKVAEEQFERFKELFQKGLKSETELEQREVALQNARYKETETQNNLMISRQELANIRNEYNSIFQDY